MTEKIVTGISTSLEEILQTYSAHGLESVYLWGSVLTEDFDIATSDIDSVGIVNDTAAISLEETIKQELESRHPEFVKFGFRIVCVQELMGEIDPISPIAVSIPPRLLLLDLPYWRYVAGKQFKISDFTNRVPTPAEGLYWRLEQLKKKGWSNLQDVEEGKEWRACKILWRILHLLEMAGGLNEPFSYSSVLKNAQDDLAPYAKVLNELKSLEYDRAVFLKKLPILHQLISVAQKKSRA